METEPQHNINKKTKVAILQTILSSLEKKEAKISILATMVGILVTIFFSVYEFPAKEGNKIVIDNQSGGKNQLAVAQLPPVQSFLQYLYYIEHRGDTSINIKRMWDNSSYFRRQKFGNVNNMMYDYFLTSKYEVQYIIPKGENNQNSVNAPKSENSFCFYALLKFEDNVWKLGEVDKLKSFHNTELKVLCDSASFEKEFEKVLEEVYDFLDCRFVIDSAEYIKSKLKDYMMDMTMMDYITKDWRFPALFAKDLQLPPKPIDRTHKATDDNQNHTMLCEVEMVEEDGEWKVNKFVTVALSRWK